MITITARINLSENGGKISSLSSNKGGNNVSANINEVLGNKSVQVGNPFILGKSKLGSGAYYANNLPYFLGSQLSDYNGNFTSSYNITISGKDITQFVIAFDVENRAFPNSIIVDGETVYDDDPIWEVNVNTADKHTVKISNWNKPNSPLIITSIYADIGIEIDRNNLISFNSDIFDRGNIQRPSYGIISNSARLTFADFDEDALDLITQKILNSGVKVEAWLNNSDSNASEQICLMQTRELTYDNNNRQVDISLKDNLEEWQDISVPSLFYYDEDGTELPPIRAAQLYLVFLDFTPKKHNMLLFDELDNETQRILKNTVVKYSTFQKDTLWNDWQKLCELCLLHIYVDNNGRTICKYNGGN